MNAKIKKNIKGIVLTIFGLMLIFNAGFDFSRWVQNERVKKAAAATMLDETIVGAEAHWCTLATDVGFYVCDMDLKLVDGRKGRVLQVFSPDDLKL